MNIEKFKKEQEFQKKVLRVFEEISKLDNMFLKNSNDPVVNLFSAFYLKDREKAGSLFTENELGEITRYLDENKDILNNIANPSEAILPIISFPYIAINTSDSVVSNEKEFYKRLLKTFIEYKKSITEYWLENDMYNLLIEKNKKYGDAVLNPVRILSTNISIKDVILSRIDEKLSRLMQDHKNEDEDIILDIIGYLIFINILLQDQM